MRITTAIPAFVALSFVLASILMPAHAEYASPRQQIESGVAPEDVQCRDGKVLAMRDGGGAACVREHMAERMGWDVVVPSEDDTKPQSIDMSGVMVRSDVMEGEYTTGLYTESVPPSARIPLALPYLDRPGLIINPDGTHGAQAAQLAVLNDPQQSQQMEDYLRYFPEYIPDGQELKFFTFSSHNPDYARLHLVYAPIVAVIDPSIHTSRHVQDAGGITLSISDTPDTWHDKEDAYTGLVFQGAGYREINGHTVAYGGGGQLRWENDDGTTFHFLSFSYDTDELFKMAQKALDQ